MGTKRQVRGFIKCSRPKLANLNCQSQRYSHPILSNAHKTWITPITSIFVVVSHKAFDKSLAYKESSTQAQNSDCFFPVLIFLGDFSACH